MCPVSSSTSRTALRTPRVTSSKGASTVVGASPLATKRYSFPSFLKKRALLVVLPQSVARITFISSGLISDFDGFLDAVNRFQPMILASSSRFKVTIQIIIYRTEVLNVEVKKTPTLKDYIAGAVLANSLAWLTLGVTPFFDTNPLTLMQLLILTYIAGIVLAGYLVTRKAFQNHIKVGLKTGLGAFVFHIYVFMGVIELITGERIFHLLDHLLILAIFITGGLAGAFLRKRLSTGKEESHDLR